MTNPSPTIGRRLPDTIWGELPPMDDILPGDYWKYVTAEGEDVITADSPASGNLTGTVWGICVPGGNGIGTLRLHTVREHDDGTISVRPDDGSSNSILQGDWHGYIDHGVWEAC